MGGTLIDGINLYLQKDYEGALAFFLSLPEDAEVDGVEVAYYLGLCYARLERYDDALVYLEQVVTSGKDYERVLQCRYVLAILYVKSGRKRLANFELNKLLEAGYQVSNVLSSIAYLYWDSNDVDRCIEFYARSLKKDADNITALNGMGYVLAESDRDLTLALSYCKKALSYSPSNAACLDSLGWVYFKMGLFEEAKKYLAQAEDLMPQCQTIRTHVRTLEEAMTRP